MKFCAKCGTQMEDEAKLCPQCSFRVFDPSGAETVSVKPPKKKINKLFVIIPAAMVATAIATFAITVSVLSKDSKDIPTDDRVSAVETTATTEAVVLATEPESTVPAATATSSTGSFATGASNEPCPAQEYGNHSWSEASCESPSQCYACGAYKDEILGNHKWLAATCIEPMRCFWCNAYKDEELGNHEFYYDEDLQEAVCRHCYLLRAEYNIEKES